jgi:hypothetical protein
LNWTENSTGESIRPSETDQNAEIESSAYKRISITGVSYCDQQIKILSNMLDHPKEYETGFNNKEKPEQIFDLDNEIDSLFKIVANMKTGTPSNSDEEDI